METTPKLGVLIIHGIGSQDAMFADKMIMKLRKRLVDPDAVKFQTIHWAPLIEENSQRAWERLDRCKLGWRFARRFFIHALGDATAYNHTVYDKVHSQIEICMMRLQQQLGFDETIPVLVIAHSLGCAMITDYIWDRQRHEGPAPDRYMSNIQGIVTFGCNLPVFALSYDPIETIHFPYPWINLYDKDDILGYPLKPLSKSYNRAVNRDIAINVGPLWASWNPLSHNYYWTDRSVLRHIAALANRLVS